MISWYCQDYDDIVILLFDVSDQKFFWYFDTAKIYWQYYGDIGRNFWWYIDIKDPLGGRGINPLRTSNPTQTKHFSNFPKKFNTERARVHSNLEGRGSNPTLRVHLAAKMEHFWNFPKRPCTGKAHAHSTHWLQAFEPPKPTMCAPGRPSQAFLKFS